MALVSIQFLIFISITLLVYFCTPLKFRWIVLLAASYVFYGLSSGWLMVFLLAATGTVYVGTRALSAQSVLLKEQKKVLEKPQFKEYKLVIAKKKRRILALCLIVCFGMLFVIKYINFLLGNVDSLVALFGFNRIFPTMNFLMPLGISYYTLQAVSYLADVYYGKYDADKHLGKVALFLAYFPHITEGPIGRYDKLGEQLYTGHRFSYENLKYGVTLLMIGFLKKLVIADRAKIYVDAVYADYQHLGGWTLLLAALLYTLEIYAEFSGCMDLAQGFSSIIGVQLTQNFRRPFFSRSVGEFWRRWHITLGAWLRDYIFYPVSLSKISGKVAKWAGKTFRGHLGKFIPMAFPLFFVWFGNGIWHGASWKYILYGLYYYIIMMIGLLCKPLADKAMTALKINVESRPYQLFQTLRTFGFVLFGMMLFRSHSTGDALWMLGRVFTAGYSGALRFGLNRIDFLILGIYVLAATAIGAVQEQNTDVYAIINRRCLVWKYVFYLFITLAILLLGIYGAGYNPSDFIYGQF